MEKDTKMQALAACDEIIAIIGRVWNKAKDPNAYYNTFKFEKDVDEKIKQALSLAKTSGDSLMNASDELREAITLWKKERLGIVTTERII